MIFWEKSTKSRTDNCFYQPFSVVIVQSTKHLGSTKLLYFVFHLIWNGNMLNKSDLKIYHNQGGANDLNSKKSKMAAK
jgi:hypothetical protein